jgi:hypothetical protein
LFHPADTRVICKTTTPTRISKLVDTSSANHLFLPQFPTLQNEIYFLYFFVGTFFSQDPRIVTITIFQFLNTSKKMMSPTITTSTFKSRIITIALLLLSSILTMTTVTAQQSCNVCRDPPAGGFRDLANPGKSFTLPNGKTFTCGSIKEAMQDIRVDGMAAPGEKHLCATSQYIVYYNCECYGTPIPGLDEEYVDPNPACSLCAGSNLDNRSVPSVNFGTLTNTVSYGNMNCQGLEQAMREGVFPPSACGAIQSSSAATCCNFSI